ncbi:MAG: flagellar hook-basal body complex protein FliE [Candidatus Brocadia sp. AMX2]|uniref:Flagellar hook-basal body complex protein FliE n=1 Tax=Candidatus Brocadia sinica JPN1 TaxID=1197129 RepID=A0ABQ0JZE7_9BACT|nr:MULTISPECIES: flagellar hook-basal body complex protein FliE [Brocadia]KXK30946.1 MAG: flagellar hook-basal body complex protein FliE [Candidatus Brocadia sinica]MBC6931257.1 flagellar hook-basal body complex protein FliE [Candidatus Brocadia sp.]MBL1168572.1 flagellar hook-basal body complex protein FliE [Candidatus Brocadia sp. AMX1]NOG40106.1 flagellar hook-basal body complex protein FliE [Planctomycetota bacterium]KAA0246044.1 MAG: flagellar hook-basal body complex protein FliE [Candida
MDISPIKNKGTSPTNKELVSLVDEQEQGPSFQRTLSGFINEVNDLQTKANASIENLATGKVENVHEVMIAMAKAEVSFKFMMEARNKLVETYKEVMRMQM